MHQFFIEPSQLQKEHIIITGLDVNHIKNVLRLYTGERIFIVCKSDGRRYLCGIQEIREEEVICRILSEEEAETELPAKVYLFQGLPKSDKMELIIQKAVELGCFEIIPMSCRRCVVKLDEKKQDSKRKRWQAISEAAAKQSKRGVIPEIHGIMDFSAALSYAENMDLKLMPYEQAAGMADTRKLISSVKAGQEVAVFIGPEGGFEEAEVEKARKAGFFPITLGRRILRTETAGFTVLGWLMYVLERDF